MPRPCSVCASLEKTRLAAEMITAGASDQSIADLLEVGRMSVHRHRHSHVVLPAPALDAAAARVTSADPPAPQPVSALPVAAPVVPADRQISSPRRGDQRAPAEKAPAVATDPAISNSRIASPRRGQGAPVDPAPATKSVAKAPAATDVINAALGLGRQAEKLVRIEDRLERMGELAEKGLSPGQVATIATAQLRAIETGAKLAGVGGFAPLAAQATGAGYDKPVFTLQMVFANHPESNRTLELYPWDGKPRNHGQPASGTLRTIDVEPEQTHGQADDDRGPGQPADTSGAEGDDLPPRAGSSAFSELVAAFGCRPMATSSDHAPNEGDATDHDV